MVPLPLLRPPAWCVPPAPPPVLSHLVLSSARLLGCLAALAPPPSLPRAHASCSLPPPPTPPTLAPTRLWTVAVYFEVLLREFSIVKQKLGARKAGLSLAFLTDAAKRRETAWPILGASWEGHSSLARAIAL